MSFGLWARTGPMNHVLDGGPDPPWQWTIFVKYKDFLQWAVQKRLNRTICRLGCGLGWAERSTSSIIFTRRRQCAHMGGHIGAIWRIRLNGGDGVLCQVTLITCFAFEPFSFVCLAFCRILPAHSININTCTVYCRANMASKVIWYNSVSSPCRILPVMSVCVFQRT